MGSSQYAFLDKDLASVNRSVTPWVVLAGHRPSYYIQSSGCVGPDTSDNFCAGSVDVEPLLMKHKVDLALWGMLLALSRMRRKKEEGKKK